MARPVAAGPAVGSQEETQMKQIELRKRKDFSAPGAEFLNAVVKKADIGVTGHFGDAVSLCLELEAEGGWHGMFMPLYNMTGSIGHVVRAVMRAIGEVGDDTACLSSLEGKPCRVVSAGDRFIGIGAFMADRWLMEHDVKLFMESMGRPGQGA